MEIFKDLLGYGISGLGLSLAILSYRLLSQEQKIKQPRSMILTSIYVYMVFSLLLAGAGLSYEIYKINSSKSVVVDIKNPHSVPESMWYDVLKATRTKLFKDAQPKEYNRGNLSTGEQSETYISIPAGGCRMYFSMTRPPAKIAVSILTPSERTIVSSPLGTEPHFAYGRVCAPKAQNEALAVLEVKMIEGEGPFVAEAYEALP
jgi:hypothetical protein